MSSRKNLVSFLKIIIKWRVMILIVVAAAAIGSIIIALLLPNYYKSTASFLPSNLSAYDRQILFNTGSSDRMINYFGDKNDIERVLAFANSSPLMNDVIYYFKLYDHYDIDTTKSRWQLKVFEEFEDNYSALKHERGYVEISILDTDKQLAADMVNFVLKRIDQVNTALVQERNQQILTMMQKQLDEKSDELQNLTDTLSTYSDTTSISFKVLFRKQTQVIEDFNQLNSLVDQYSGTVGSNFSSIYIIEPAQPAIKKSKPIRWLIVVSATLIALFLAVISAVIIEQYKDIRQEIYA